MKKKFKKIPFFKNEDEERNFWSNHDSTEYIDWDKAQKIRFVNLKPTTQAISLRLPVNLLSTIKLEANKRDIPYQSFMKMLLGEHFK